MVSFFRKVRSHVSRNKKKWAGLLAAAAALGIAGAVANERPYPPSIPDVVQYMDNGPFGPGGGSNLIQNAYRRLARLRHVPTQRYAKRERGAEYALNASRSVRRRLEHSNWFNRGFKRLRWQ